MALAESGLDWIILRPGTLNDLPGTGRVHLGPAAIYDEISRDDVAVTIAELQKPLSLMTYRRRKGRSIRWTATAYWQGTAMVAP
jgi:hypothetical protein